MLRQLPVLVTATNKEDVTGPLLVNASLVNGVNLCNKQPYQRLNAKFSDLSGFGAFDLVACGPGGALESCENWSWDSGPTGVSNNWDMKFPQDAAVGTWTVTDICLRDAVGNSACWFAGTVVEVLTGGHEFEVAACE